MSYALYAPLSAVGSPLSTEFHRPTPPSTQPECTGHIYSLLSTIPKTHLFWYPPCPRKTLTITGESKLDLLKQFKEAILQSHLSLACNIAVELHCSGYFLHAFLILSELVGSHVHIHNPNLASRLAHQYRKFSKQLAYPPQCGTLDFPTQDDQEFYERKEITNLQATINNQLIRNFVAESVALVTLSHQKEMTLPIIKQEDIVTEHLCKQARRHKVGGNNPERIAQKNELMLVIALIQRLLFYKTPKTRDVIYWILWIVKLENKFKKRGDKLSCPRTKISGVEDNDHWSWHIWKIILARVSRMPRFKQTQIADIYLLYKISFTKSLFEKKIHLLFLAIDLLTTDLNNSFPAVINHLHLYVQAISNVNSLYRNLTIKLARKSWTSVCNATEVQKIDKLSREKEKKLTKTEIKQQEKNVKIKSLNEKMEYLNIVPTRMAFIDTAGFEKNDYSTG